MSIVEFGKMLEKSIESTDRLRESIEAVQDTLEVICDRLDESNQPIALTLNVDALDAESVKKAIKRAFKTKP